MVALIAGSIAAAPANDNTWLVATEDRIIRQKTGDDDGIHIRQFPCHPYCNNIKTVDTSFAYP